MSTAALQGGELDQGETSSSEEEMNVREKSGMPEEIGKYSHLQKRESESGNQWSSDNGATAWEKRLCGGKNQNAELIFKTELEL